MGNVNTRPLVVLDVLREVVGVRLGPVSAGRAIDTTESSSLGKVSDRSSNWAC
jgi:hypothetical protein